MTEQDRAQRRGDLCSLAVRKWGGVALRPYISFHMAHHTKRHCLNHGPVPASWFFLQWQQSRVSACISLRGVSWGREWWEKSGLHTGLYLQETPLIVQSVSH